MTGILVTDVFFTYTVFLNTLHTCRIGMIPYMDMVRHIKFGLRNCVIFSDSLLSVYDSIIIGYQFHVIAAIMVQRSIGVKKT
jgi:hypothetical protein